MNKALLDSGLLFQVIPELEALVGIDHGPHHPEGDPFTHTMLVVDATQDRTPIGLMAALLHDLGKATTGKPHKDKGHMTFYGHAEVGAPIAKAVMERLKFSRKEIDTVVFLVSNHMKMHTFHKMKLAKRKRLMEHDVFPQLIQLHIADRGEHNVDEIAAQYEAFLNAPDEFRLTGRDLINMRMIPGKHFADILRMVRDEQLEENIRSLDEAKDFVMEKVNQGTFGKIEDLFDVQQG